MHIGRRDDAAHAAGERAAREGRARPPVIIVIIKQLICVYIYIYTYRSI